MTFVNVASFDNYIDANITLGKLQNEGINCWLQDENSATITPFFSNSIGGIKLMVVDSQVERANELLTFFNKRSSEQ
jgi:hypothetical protein